MTKEKFSVIDGRLNMVVGFMFTPDRSRVVLIKKLRPTWQVGLLNGVGGRVREGEPPMQAMIREFEEETGVREENWESLCALKFKKGLIYFYYTFSNQAMDVKTMESEEVRTWDASLLYMLKTVSNLQWLIPMVLELSDVEKNYSESGRAMVISCSTK